MEDRSLTIRLPITRESFFAAVLVLVLAIGGWLLYCSPLSFTNNRFHRHRWASDVCRARGVAVEQCEIVVWKTNPNISSEVPIWDICLEHGEIRRLK